MALSHFRMLIHELLNEDPYMVPEEAPLIFFDGKSSVCMAKNGKDNKTYQTHCKENAFCKEWRKTKDAKIDWCKGNRAR